MNKKEKIGKVMKEFKDGTLKTSAGKKVKSRKQAVAIAMSESEGYAEKADLISQINIDSLQEAEDILKAAGEEELFEKAKHQDGDMHPNGKWVWVSSANGGKGDWRTKGGRTHTKHSAGGNAGTGSTTTTQQKPTTTGMKDYAKFSESLIKHYSQKKYFDNVSLSDIEEDFITHLKDQSKNPSASLYMNAAKEVYREIMNKHREMKSSDGNAGTLTTSKRDEDFKKLMRNASDTVLNKIVSGKIQASDRDKELAQEILNDRKKPKVGDVSKLTAQQKSMVDKVMDKGFLMTSSKYNDKSKIELKKTLMGNWRCYYDGRDVGIINGKLISDTAAKKIGWYKEETKSATTEPTDTTQTKPKKRPIGVGTNGPEKRKKESTGVDTLKYESKNGFKFKKSGHYKMRYNQREKAYEIWEQGDIYGAKTAMMQIKSENENIGMDIIKHMKEKYSKGGSGSMTYSNTTYAF